MSVVWEVLVAAVADVAVDAPAWASAAPAQFCSGASPRGSVVIRDFSFPHLHPDRAAPVASGPRDSPSQRGQQEAAAVHAGMVGRMRAKVNHVIHGPSGLPAGP